MPKFSYVAKTKDSQSIREVEEAANKEDLINKLRSRGLFIVSIAEVSTRPSPGKTASSSSSPVMVNLTRKGKRFRVTLYDKALLARNLATTLSSGITLLRSLEILAVQTESSQMENILKDCNEGIKNGLSLSEAIAKHSNVFGKLWQGIVEVGEASGNLSFVLEKLADYLEMRMDFERKIKSAMVYPSILIIASFGAMTIFFKFILPKFTSLFDQFKIDLPLPTKIVFAISQLFEKYFFIGAVVAIGLGILIVYLLKQPEFRKIWDEYSLKIPLLGAMLFLSVLERFSSTIQILLESGLPLVYTLEIAGRSLNNLYLEKYILSIKDKVKDGSSLSEEMRKLNMFPLLLAEMAHIGEETGTMPEIFKKISTHYQKELSTAVERFLIALEPVMIIFMGVMIGGLVIALFMPLFKLSTMSN